MQNITAEIIAIGTEILLGELTDTNSVYISRALRDIGINVYFMTSVGDNEGRIASAITIAMKRADIVITCGGLGPTVDDMTRQAVANATHRELIYHSSLYEEIADRFAMYHMKMPENNRRQAFLPAHAEVIQNPVGTAPSFIVTHDGKTIISLPGVPREMKFLMQDSVIPYLLKTHQLGIIKARILKTAGIGESALDQLLGDDLLNLSNPTIGLAAHQGVIDIRLTAKAENIEESDILLDELANQVYERVGRFIFGEGETQLIDVFSAFLLDNHLTCHFVEVGTDAMETVLSQIDGTSSVKIDSFNIATAIEKYQLSTKPLKELAQEIINIHTQGTTYNAIAVVVADEYVDEGSDASANTAITLWVNGIVSSRVYGFGGKNALAKEWISRWIIASLWQMLKQN